MFTYLSSISSIIFYVNNCFHYLYNFLDQSIFKRLHSVAELLFDTEMPHYLWAMQYISIRCVLGGFKHPLNSSPPPPPPPPGSLAREVGHVRRYSYPMSGKLTQHLFFRKWPFSGLARHHNQLTSTQLENNSLEKILHTPLISITTFRLHKWNVQWNSSPNHSNDEWTPYKVYDQQDNTKFCAKTRSIIKTEGDLHNNI